MTNSAGPEGSLVFAVNAVKRLLAGQEGGKVRVSSQADSRECLILRFVEVPSNECLHVGRAIHLGQASIKEELGYSRGSLNFDLQYIRLRREQHPELELLRRHLVGHGMRGLDEHCIGYAGRVRSVDRQADSGEGIEVVGL
jgi:hypothetical protein